MKSPPLRIELTKQPDGSGVLRCTRPDGSSTWQKQTKHATHFALHDLTHIAVETALRARHGFFGLIAQGWEIEDTTGKGARGPLPKEATEIESVVGLFDSERASGAVWTAEEFNSFSPISLSQTQILAIRAKRGELFRRWRELEPGQTLALSDDISIT